MKTKREYIEVVRLVRIEYENGTARRSAIARAKASRFDSFTASRKGCFGVKHTAKVRVIMPNDKIRDADKQAAPTL